MAEVPKPGRRPKVGLNGLSPDSAWRRVTTLKRHLPSRVRHPKTAGKTGPSTT